MTCATRYIRARNSFLLHPSFPRGSRPDFSKTQSWNIEFINSKLVPPETNKFEVGKMSSEITPAGTASRRVRGQDSMEKAYLAHFNLQLRALAAQVQSTFNPPTAPDTNLALNITTSPRSINLPSNATWRSGKSTKLSSRTRSSSI